MRKVAAFLSLSLAVAACGGNPNNVSTFGYDDDGTTFMEVGPVLTRGLKPGCWFGEGSAFPDYAYNGDLQNVGDTTRSVRVYTVERATGEGTPLLIVTRFYRNAATGRMSFSGVVGVRKGDAANPDVPAVTARVRTDYENYRETGELPCTDLQQTG
ncbi:MAG: hypothetical protein AAGI70_09275 [Pseudomonadota bacterium]